MSGQKTLSPIKSAVGEIEEARFAREEGLSPAAPQETGVKVTKIAVRNTALGKDQLSEKARAAGLCGTFLAVAEGAEMSASIGFKASSAFARAVHQADGGPNVCVYRILSHINGVSCQAWDPTAGRWSDPDPL